MQVPNDYLKTHPGAKARSVAWWTKERHNERCEILRGCLLLSGIKAHSHDSYLAKYIQVLEKLARAHESEGGPAPPAAAALLAAITRARHELENAR